MKPTISESAIRESFTRFPSAVQPLWTLFTGKALPGERPLVQLSPLLMLLLTLTGLVSLLALQLALLRGSGTALWLGLVCTPMCGVLITGMLRKIQVVYVHHSAHLTFVQGRPTLNRWVGHVLTSFAFIQNLDAYKRDHFEHHSRRIFSTLDDADAQLLYRFRLRPGRSVPQLRLALIRTLFSPTYHAYFFGSRLRSNLVDRPWPWRIVSLVWLAAIVVGLPLVFGWWPVATALWLPWVVGYQMSALLQFLTEHVWLISEKAPQDRKDYADRCLGRFFGDMLPKEGHWVGWCRWWARLVLLHAPARFGIVVGDLPAHDWHHLCGFVGHHPSRWTHAIYARQESIDAGDPMGMAKREFWGLPQVIDHVLGEMSRAKPLDAESRSFISLPVADTSLPRQ